MTAVARQLGRPAGKVRLVLDLRDGLRVIAVTAGKETTYYTLREIGCEIGGRGFAVHKLGMGTLYHVRVGEPDDNSCECLGFLRHGCCKHILGLLALVQAGKV